MLPKDASAKDTVAVDVRSQGINVDINVGINVGINVAEQFASRQRAFHRIYGAVLIAIFALLLAHSYRADRADIVVDSTTLFADFLHVQGLRAGDTVTLAGVSIGKVTGISLQQPSLNVRVRIAIEKGVAIPADSAAVIRSPDLAGTKMLVIEPGGEDQILMEGESFSYTREPIELPHLIDTIVERAEYNLATRKKN